MIERGALSNENKEYRFFIVVTRHVDLQIESEISFASSNGNI